MLVDMEISSSEGSDDSLDGIRVTWKSEGEEEHSECLINWDMDEVEIIDKSVEYFDFGGKDYSELSFV